MLYLNLCWLIKAYYSKWGTTQRQKISLTEKIYNRYLDRVHENISQLIKNKHKPCHSRLLKPVSIKCKTDIYLIQITQPRLFRVPRKVDNNRAYISNKQQQEL